MFNIAICDDEAEFLKLIKSYIQNKMKIECEIFDTVSAYQLIEYIRKNKVDFLFLDIDMPEINGLEIAEKYVSEDTLLIFVSQFDNLVYKSLKYSPFRFIRKSRLEELEEAIESGLNKLSDYNYEFKLKDRKNIFVSLNDILYFEGARNYSIMCTKYSKYYEARITMKEIEERLKDKGFIRIHNGFIINIKYIEIVGANSIMILNSEQKLPLSEKYKDGFYKTILKYKRR